MDQKSILLVEDNPDDEELTLRALAENGVDTPVIVAHDGQEAVDYLFDAGRALPAFILLDLKIPKISGLEVLRQVRANARTRLIPVIVLTSSTQDSDLVTSYGLGGNSYIVKSFDFEMFTMEIGLVVRYWREINRPAPSNNVVAGIAQGR